MSSNTAEEPTAHVLAGSYYIRNGNNFLAVRNGSIVVQAQSYIWNVSVKGNLNYIQNPADSKFLHDETNENKLDPGQTLSGRWAGASVTKYPNLPPISYPKDIYSMLSNYT